MTRPHLPPTGNAVAELNDSLARSERDLEILDQRAPELNAIERETQLEMKQRDRAYKDSHFHSIPKPIKHTRP